MKHAILTLALTLTGCATYSDVKELKLVGFDGDISGGKPVGQFEADDCTYRILGYSLGGAPDISRAIANARTRKKTAVTDVATGGSSEGAPLRYATNITTEYGGFNAGIFGKSCITVKGMGYL